MRNIHRIKKRKATAKPKLEWCVGGEKPLKELTARAHKKMEPLQLRVREDEEAASKLQQRWKARCPDCGRRLHPKKVQRGTIEREFVGFVVPKHKAA